MGCDLLRAAQTTDDVEISIHAPQWGATTCSATSFPLSRYFNPRTPVGCDVADTILDRIRPISIHAPQWGATEVKEEINHMENISIHAPQWGATLSSGVTGSKWVFKSTHPSGVRLRRLHHPNRLRDFNPRTPVGCDVICIPRHCRNRRFQSTHPSGVRPVSSIRVQRPHHISIHAPQWGATERLSSKPGGRVISIHAPQWGATGHINIRCTAGAYFNPRTPVGCDLTLNRFVNELILFQSTHPSGVRQARRHQPRRKPCYFNPRTPVGCDDHRVLFHALERISIHAPQWGAT